MSDQQTKNTGAFAAPGAMGKAVMQPPKSFPAPTIGRVVIYQLPASAVARYPGGREHAAIVTGVLNADTVDLFVLFNRQAPERRDGVVLVTAVKDSGAEEHWHWPQGAPQQMGGGMQHEGVLQALRFDLEDAKAEMSEAVGSVVTSMRGWAQNFVEHGEKLDDVHQRLSTVEAALVAPIEGPLTGAQTGGDAGAGALVGSQPQPAAVAVTDEELKAQPGS